jgi:Poly(R)-hydroxyalkanoic acid synthase subunit (PHA_synth_III_E)
LRSAHNMEAPTPDPGFKPDAAITEAAGRFFELLKTFGAAGSGAMPEWSALAAPLATQFEQWLRLSQSAAPWFATTAAVPGAGPGGAWGAPGTAGAGFPPLAWPFASLPLGVAGASSGQTRALELFGRLGQLQAQLASHWTEVANTAAQRFVARVGGIAGTPGSADQALKLYELWVNCAEEAYAATVHRSDFARLQADIANTSAALLIEQRRSAETLARVFGLPTRSEVDALGAQLRELRRELTGRVDAPTASEAPAAERGAPSEARTGARGARGSKRPRPKGPSRASGRRAPARRPRR